jgi:hypothetical protein
MKAGRRAIYSSIGGQYFSRSDARIDFGRQRGGLILLGKPKRALRPELWLL